MVCCIDCIDCCCAACFSLATCKTFPTFSCASIYLETHLSRQLISPRWRSASLCFLDAHLWKHEAVSLLNRVVYISISVCAEYQGIKGRMVRNYVVSKINNTEPSCINISSIVNPSYLGQWIFMMCSEQILVWMTGNHSGSQLISWHVKWCSHFSIIYHMCQHIVNLSNLLTSKERVRLHRLLLSSSKETHFDLKGSLCASIGGLLPLDICSCSLVAVYEHKEAWVMMGHRSSSLSNHSISSWKDAPAHEVRIWNQIF